MNLTTLTSRTAAAVVAAVAGTISYGHIRQVATRVGEADLAGWLLPLSVDGLVVVGTMAVLEDRRQNRHPRLSARVAIVAGVLATVAFNIASAEAHWGARAVAAAPAVAFLLAVEVLSRTGRPRTDSGEGPEVARTLAVTAIGGGVREVDTPAAAIDSAGEIPEQGSRQHAPRRRSDAFGLRTESGGGKRAGRPSSAQRVTAELARTPDASNAAIAARLGISADTVRRHRRPSSAGETPARSEVDGRQPALIGV